MMGRIAGSGREHHHRTGSQEVLRKIATWSVADLEAALLGLRMAVRIESPAE